jgi:hypothetical protein
MRCTIATMFLFFSLVSWKADLKGPWITTRGNRIILHSRPLNYTRTESPDSLTLQKIIREQERAIDIINERLHLDFNSEVDIYLYNLDEAKEKIGTNGGGFASLKKSESRIYFTFRNEPLYNTIKDTYEYVGVHEMVHVVTNSKLGGLTTSFFGEGYSNAVDGNCGSQMVHNHLAWYRNDSTLAKIIRVGKFKTPTELLHNEDIPVREYYPQVGCLVNWLFETYGVDKINRLYAVKKDKVQGEFFKETGERFEDMEKKYLKYRQVN